MHCVHPEAFLLLPLLWLWLRRQLWPHALLGLVRVTLLLLLVTLLAQPYRSGVEDGRDIVLVVDGSRSVPDGELARVQEFARELQGKLAPGDRLGLVRFGRHPVVERAPEATFAWPVGGKVLDVDGSDLTAAVAAGMLLIPPRRQGSLLVWSDGEATGEPVENAARAALRAGLRIDATLVSHAVGNDVAVADLSLPPEVAIGEPFVITASIVSDTVGPAHWQLSVDGEQVGSGDADLLAGRNALQFRRAFEQVGEHEVRIEVTRPGDAVPQNDRGLAVVRAKAPARVLCVTPGGREDRLTRSLRQLGLTIVTTAPATAPLSLGGLDAFRAVVLEDVAAGDLPVNGMRALQTWVEELGGGLLMTGGKASFGIGGYYRSPIEAVLPVTMEIRDEQRRFGLAMAIALDRSGSMRQDAGGETKMTLADRGAATAVELLSPIDSVAVLAVDQEAHVVVPLRPVTDKQQISSTVRAIESMGGGIDIAPALHGAAAQLEGAVQKTRHLVLFADASDSQEPGDYRTFVPTLASKGITVSVIGLGNATDSDAALLQEIARLGNGRCQFVANAADLPRVFAQETIQVARSSLVEEPTAVKVMPGLSMLGDMPPEVPTIGGYSIAWQRPTAELALQGADEHAAPLLSHWQVGLGRAAACLAEVDGALSGELATWPRYADFFGTLVRWLVGGQAPGLFVEARREGAVGVFSLEVEAARAAQLDTVRGVVTAADGRAVDLVFERQAPGRVVARVALEHDGIYRGAVQLAGDSVRLPPLALPYSPEYAPRADGHEGERTLRELVRTTGGHLDPSPQQVVDGPRRSAGAADLGPWFASAAVVVFLLEILVRRFGFAWRHGVREASTDGVAAASTSAPRAASVPEPEPEPESGVLDALARARHRGRRRS